MQIGIIIQIYNKKTANPIRYRLSWLFCLRNLIYAIVEIFFF